MRKVFIDIQTDNYAYLTTGDDNKLMDLLIKSFTREEREYNNFYRTWETRKHIECKIVIDKKTDQRQLQVKAGLVPYLCHSLRKNRIDFELVNHRPSIKGIFAEEDIVTHLCDGVNLRSYQKQAAKAILSVGFGCVQLPTSAGKTEVVASAMLTYFNKFPHDAVLYVVPTVMLKNEAKARFTQYGLKVNDDFPLIDGAINILTYMALNRADNNKFGYKERDKVKAVIWDEAHRLAAPKTQKIVHRFKCIQMSIGMSATPSEETKQKFYLKDLNSKDMAVFGVTGRLLYSMSVADTIERDYVTKIEVHVIEHTTKQKLYDDENDWHIVKNCIIKDKERAQFSARYIKKFFDEHNLHTALVYIPEIEWSQLYMTEVAKEYQSDSSVRVLELYGGGRIYEHRKRDGKLVQLTKDEAKQALEDIRSDKVKTIISGTSFIKEGINIISIQALFSTGGVKGAIPIKQIVGRAMRKHDDKDVAYICEIGETNNPVIQSQLRKKLDIYTSEYQAKVVFDYLNDKIASI